MGDEQGVCRLLRETRNERVAGQTAGAAPALQAHECASGDPCFLGNLAAHCRANGESREMRVLRLEAGVGRTSDVIPRLPRSDTAPRGAI